MFENILQLQKKCACLAEKDLAINMLAEINYGHSHYDNDNSIDISTNRISNSDKEDTALSLSRIKGLSTFKSESEFIPENSQKPLITEQKNNKYFDEFLLFNAFTVRNLLLIFFLSSFSTILVYLIITCLDSFVVLNAALEVILFSTWLRPVRSS